MPSAARFHRSNRPTAPSLRWRGRGECEPQRPAQYQCCEDQNERAGEEPEWDEPPAEHLLSVGPALLGGGQHAHAQVPPMRSYPQTNPIRMKYLQDRGDERPDAHDIAEHPEQAGHQADEAHTSPTDSRLQNEKG